jgi:hypothetical protein
VSRVPGMERQPRGQSWVTPLRCVGCGEKWTHIELSEFDDDDQQGWPVMQPCPRCGRLGTMQKVESQ